MKELLIDLIERYPCLATCEQDIASGYALLAGCYEEDGIVYLCGNGGSAADAEHIVGELMKSFMVRRPISKELVERINDASISDRLEAGLRAVSLTSPLALNTAFANDVAPELVFAQQVAGYARKGDILWAISTSGNSRNVLQALKVARAVGCRSIGLSGQDGGQMADLCDVCIRVPATAVHVVQELHLPVYHALCRMLEERFFGSASKPE